MQHLGAAEPEKGENLRVAVRADVHKMAPGYLLDPGVAARLQVQAELVWMVCLLEHTARAHMFAVVFRAPGALCSNMSPVRQRTHVSLQHLLWIGSMFGGEFVSNA